MVYRIAGNFRGVQFSRKGNLQRCRGLIFADGHSITAPPTIPGWLRLLPHAQLQRSYTTFLQNELLSIKAHRCSHSILSSVFSYLKSSFGRKLLTVASFSSIRTLFGFDHSLHFCVSWFYGRRWHCRRQRATWIRKLGSIARRLKIALQRHSCRSTTNWWAACKIANHDGHAPS